MAWHCSGITNEEMVSKLKDANIIKNNKVEAAMLSVDRAKYCHDLNPYQDRPRGIGFSVTISAPHMHAYALTFLIDQLFDGAKALDIGSGSGYLTACMAHMVGVHGLVIGIDHITELVEMSIQNVEEDHPEFLQDGRIKFLEGDGRLGAPAYGPYNAIHVGAAADSVPVLNIVAFETDVLKHEFERLQSRHPMEVLSMKRYELPPPPPGKMNDLAAWNESVENSFAQLEHQATRICNLELMMIYGCEIWKVYLKVLVKLVAGAQKQIQALRKMIQEVNWQRKSMQTQGGENLRALEAEWVGLVSKNYEIEQACVYLEDEINKITIQRGGHLVEINEVPGEEQENVLHQNLEL